MWSGFDELHQMIISTMILWSKTEDKMHPLLPYRNTQLSLRCFPAKLMFGLALRSTLGGNCSIGWLTTFSFRIALEAIAEKLALIGSIT